MRGERWGARVYGIADFLPRFVASTSNGRMASLIENIKANLAKNNAWKAPVEASIVSRAAMLEILKRAYEIAEEARKIGVNIVISDGAEDDSFGMHLAPKVVYFKRVPGGKIRVQRGASGGSAAETIVEAPSSGASEWAEHIIEDQANYLTDESLSAEFK